MISMMPWQEDCGIQDVNMVGACLWKNRVLKIAVM